MRRESNLPPREIGVVVTSHPSKLVSRVRIPYFASSFLGHMKPVEILLLLSDLEGSATNCRKLGFVEDSLVLDEMKKRYYKLYFKLKKEQSNPV